MLTFQLTFMANDDRSLIADLANRSRLMIEPEFFRKYVAIVQVDEKEKNVNTHTALHLRRRRL